MMTFSMLRDSNRKSSRLLVVLCSLLFVFAVACGDDPEDSNNSPNNANNDNDATVDAGDAGDVGGDDGGGDDAGDDAGDAGDDTGDAGLCQPLDPAPADQAECSILCQDCAGDDEACIRGVDQQSGDTVMVCQPAGPAGQGQTCNQNTRCQAGLGCFIEEQGATEGTCRRFCRLESGDDPQCEENETCLRVSQDDDRFGACFSTQNNCEPYPNDECGQGETCEPRPASNECVTFNDTASAGDSCGSTSECNNQQACTNFGEGGQCFDLCDPDADDCAEGEQCVGVLFEQGGDPQYYVCQAA